MPAAMFPIGSRRVLSLEPGARYVLQEGDPTAQGDLFDAEQ
jgi:hypothetical protein